MPEAPIPAAPPRRKVYAAVNLSDGTQFVFRVDGARLDNGGPDCGAEYASQIVARGGEALFGYFTRVLPDGSVHTSGEHWTVLNPEHVLAVTTELRP